MTPVATLADQTRSNRKAISEDNPFNVMQENVSRQIVNFLDGWRDMSESAAERLFFRVYGAPALQAAMGIDQGETMPLRKAAKNPLHHELLQKQIVELRSHMSTGGLREALIRGLLFAGMARGSVDERGFEMVRRIRQRYDEMSLASFNATVREQYLMLLVDTEAALAAIPAMLPDDVKVRLQAFEMIKDVLSAGGRFSGDDEERLQRAARLFDLDGNPSTTAPDRKFVPAPRKERAVQGL